MSSSATLAATPRARVVTALGDIVAELQGDRAPQSVAAFLSEAAAGSYDGGAFARIVRTDNDQGAPTIEVIQAWGAKPTEVLVDLTHEGTDLTGLSHGDGVLSFPRVDGGLGTAQSFFICIGEQPALDHGGGRAKDGLGFAAFGRVVEGMEVIRAIHGVQTLEHADHAFLEGQIAAEPVAIYRIGLEADAPAARLADLAADYWRFRVREFPTEATTADDPGVNRRLDHAGDADQSRRTLLCAAMLARARGIEGGGLNDDDRATLSLLEGQLELILQSGAVDEHRRPMLFPFGFADVPDMLARQTALNTWEEREDFAIRLAEIPRFIDENLALLRSGLDVGYRIPRVLLPRIISQLDGHLADGEGLAATVDQRLAPAISGTPAERAAEQRGRIGGVVAGLVLPALRQVRECFATLGETALTDQVGLCFQPGGREFYRFKIRQQVSIDMDPEAIHAMGLEEVARIQAELDALIEEMGRPGDRAAVAAELDRTIAESGEDLLTRVRAFAKQVDGVIPRLFRRLPAITYAVEPMSRTASEGMPPALAQPSPADRSMPGVFWLTALPEKCPLHLIVPLTLHEAWPGHLMQFAIAHQLAHLPAFRRFGWTQYNGYVEGWALYCERLGYEFGFYRAPNDRFGLLSFELWRAARLVVDTGLHWKGWDRDEAIDYLASHTFLPKTVVESEVDRYIGMPAQALSYKIGERTISGLRSQAEDALGQRFSLREFHDEILSLGPVSLTVLRERLADWTDTRRSDDARRYA